MEINAAVTYEQIGFQTLIAACGGINAFRVSPDTLGFPVGRGYVVTVTLDPSDTYIVRRCFRRKGEMKVKGEQTMVYCDELSDTFWKASCFVNVEFGGHNA